MTVILTSCGRFDLLRITLQSFFNINTYPIQKFVIYDDKGANNYTQQDFEDVHSLQRDFNNVLWIIPPQRVGQILSLDSLMSEVDTEYYFNLEDDWETVKDGFIPESIKILEAFPTCNQVQIRGRKNINGHPSYRLENDTGLEIYKLIHNHMGRWHGWGFNPSVRRIADYRLLQKYSKHTTFHPTEPWRSEIDLGKWYAKRGFWTAAVLETYIRHIGDGRGIRF